ncbi:MAG: helix-turn-helix domain-containing protein [Candidatus Nanopelagicaceae bacterium]|nr:helix-turn-helix domain-containing protein [Candidatus Nanopelagicaceae bacterium]
MDGRIIYSEETRIEAARQFALGNGSQAVATFLGLPRATVRTWQDAHRRGHLLNSGAVRENKSYSQQLKQAAVEKFLAGTPKAEIIDEFEISTRAVFDKWVAAYRKDGPAGLAPKPNGRKPSVVGKESLEQKVYRLEMENALLKKFQALVAEKKAAQPSKRKQSRR